MTRQFNNELFVLSIDFEHNIAPLVGSANVLELFIDFDDPRGVNPTFEELLIDKVEPGIGINHSWQSG